MARRPSRFLCPGRAPPKLDQETILEGLADIFLEFTRFSAGRYDLLHAQNSVFVRFVHAAVIVPGGGLALLRCMPAVQQEEAQCEGDERTGVQILRRALEIPSRQIAESSSVDGGVVVARMANGSGNLGFDAARKEYVDLVEAGIIDPTKVIRIALENAVSVASSCCLLRRR